MQIGKVLYPITTLGPGVRVGVWTTGCLKNCKGCSNPELQIFDESTDIEPEKLVQALDEFSYEGVTVSGGEPFLQVAQLKKLIEAFLLRGVEDILVYTGYWKEELEAKHDKDIEYIFSHIAVLIDGPFVQELVDDTPLRGSSNQRVWVFKEAFTEKYRACLEEEKRIEVFRFDHETHYIGIPKKNSEK